MSAPIERVLEFLKGKAMESFEFLGGRYNRPEQIMSGPVQAFRAQNAANGRTVFIHRVSTTEAPEEQSALLKLLTTAVVKSPDARRLVLDFGEESGYWYVVTESEPQCALLREWLQLEIDALSGGPRPGSATAPKPPAAPPPTLQPAADPGEFTRFLQSRPPMNSPTSTKSFIPPPPDSPAPTGEFSKLFQSPSTQPPPPPPSAPAPGEFTSFFNSPAGARPTPPATPNNPPPTPPVTPPAPPEPGEFTRFFNSGLPPAPPKPQTPQATASFDRPQNNPYVQRPNTPVPPATPKPDAGEFTRLFSRPDNVKPVPGQQPPPPPGPSIQQPGLRSDPMGFAQPDQPRDLSDNLFNDKIDLGPPLPSPESQSSEFTKIFGKMGAEAPPVQPASGVAAPPVKPLLDEQAPIEDPFKVTQPLPVMNPQAPVAESKSSAEIPSEFTMIMRGGYGSNKPAEPAAPQTGNAPASNKGSDPLLTSMKGPAFTPQAIPAIPKPGNATASAGGVQASAGASGASLAAPQIPGAKIQIPPPTFQMSGGKKSGSNKKLIIFFVCLGVLALILIVVVMLYMKTQ